MTDNADRGTFVNPVPAYVSWVEKLPEASKKMDANADRELAEKNERILMLVDLLAGERAVSRRLGCDARCAWERLRQVQDSVCNLRAELEREKGKSSDLWGRLNECTSRAIRAEAKLERAEFHVRELEPAAQAQSVTQRYADAAQKNLTRALRRIRDLEGKLKGRKR